MADRDTTLQIRISPSEKQSFEMAAEMSGISVSAWARQSLRRTAAAAAAELRPMGFKVPFAEGLRHKDDK